MSIVWTELLQRVQEYLNSQNWNYSINDDAFQLSFSLDNQLEECSMDIRILTHGDKGFSIRTNTTCPVIVPVEKEECVFEFITRANYGMVDGYFSYQPPACNTEGGIIEYNSWLYCNDMAPTLNDVESSVDFPLRIMMNYGDALFNILKRDANPEEEIQRVEG